jgi:hypothetical protein
LILKRTIATALLITLLLNSVSAIAAEQPSALYTAKTSPDAPLYTVMDKKSKPEGSIRSGTKIDVLEVHPDWLLVRTDRAEGYIRRKNIDQNSAEPVDSSTTPAYPAVPNAFLAWISETAPVMDQPDAGGQELITLYPGARVALIGMENGWGKLIFKRQYGYIDSRLFSELQMLFPALEDNTDLHAPLAAYTSFYLIDETEVNIGRMKNLQVSCDKFESIVIQPGDTFNFNRDLGPYRASNGYFPAIVLLDGKSVVGYGGGTCQVSSTLYNVVLQLPGLKVAHRRPHGPGGISYLPLGADAAVGTETQNFIFKNNYPFPIRIDGTAQDGALTLAIFKVSASLP